MDAMTKSEAVEQVKMLLGFRRSLDSDIVTQLSLAQRYLELGPTIPWFLLAEVNSTITTVGGRRIVVPEDFIREYEEGALWYAPDGENEVALTKDDNDYLMDYYGTTAEGEPKAYSLDGKYFKIYPLPDDEYTVKLLYYKHDTPISTLVDDATCLWLTNAPDCIIGRAGFMLATGLGNKIAMEAFKSLEATGRVTLYNENESRKHVNRTYQIGGPEV
jgi:hypothetical protein